MNAMQMRDECQQIIQDHYGLNRRLTNTELVAEVRRLARKWRDGSLDYRAEHLSFRLDLAGALARQKSTR